MQGIKRGMVDRIKGATKEVAEGAGETSSVISRHPEGKTNAKYEHDESGFLWSWNFMISKRWKNISNTGATGDIQFMDKLLADFRRALVRPLQPGSGLQGMIKINCNISENFATMKTTDWLTTGRSASSILARLGCNHILWEMLVNG